MPVEWLIDDEQDWPPPQASRGAESLTDDELLTEIARRQRILVSRLRKNFEEIRDNIDWLSTAINLYSIPIGKPIPGELHVPMQYARFQMRAAEEGTIQYEVLGVAQAKHQSLPGSEYSSDELDPEQFFNELIRWSKENPAFDLVHRYYELKAGAQGPENKKAADGSALGLAVREIRQHLAGLMLTGHRSVVRNYWIRRYLGSALRSMTALTAKLNTQSLKNSYQKCLTPES